MCKKCIVYFVHASSIGDLKLVISFILNIVYMASDSCAYTGGDLGCRNAYKIITYPGVFTRGNRDACKWHKQTVSADYLKQLSFVYIFWIDPVVVDDRTQTRTGECDLSMWIFLLEKICMVSGGKRILAEVVET